MPVPHPSFPATSSIKTLLNGLFDVTGATSSPATPFPAALETYLADRQGRDDWMLGSFVMGSWQWEELLKEEALLSAEAPLPIQVLLPSSDKWDGGHPQMEEAIARTEELLPQFEGRVTITSLAWTLPADALRDGTSAVACVSRAEAIVGSSSFAPCPRYVAFVPDEAFQHTVPLYLLALGAQTTSHLLHAMISPNKQPAESGIEALVRFIHGAIRTARPFKVGGHPCHALRTVETDSAACPSGFVNILFATTLGQSEGLDPATLGEILSDTDPSHFIFTRAGIEWNGLRASNTALIHCRRQLMRSVSSGTLDAPRDALFRLGLLSQ